MTAKNEFPIHPSTNSTYTLRAVEAMYAEIDRLRAEVADLKGGPWQVWHFDPHDDDNRGGSNPYMTFRSKARADELAAKYNQEAFDYKNAEAKRQWRGAHRIWEASLKLDPEPTFTPIPLKTTGHGWTQDEHWYVEPLEVDDE